MGLKTRNKMKINVTMTKIIYPKRKGKNIIRLYYNSILF